MTRNEAVETTVSVAFFCTLVVGLWQPAWQWVTWVGTAVFLAGIVFSLATSSPADRERRRKGTWVAPVMLFLVAAQVVYSAAPGGQVRALLLGGGLAAAGVALYWANRRAA